MSVFPKAEEGFEPRADAASCARIGAFPIGIRHVVVEIGVHHGVRRRVVAALSIVAAEGKAAAVVR